MAPLSPRRYYLEHFRLLPKSVASPIGDLHPDDRFSIWPWYSDRLFQTPRNPLFQMAEWCLMRVYSSPYSALYGKSSSPIPGSRDPALINLLGCLVNLSTGPASFENPRRGLDRRYFLPPFGRSDKS